MTRASRCSVRSTAAVALALVAACERPGSSDPVPTPARADSRPFTPWHSVETPLPFPDEEWFWQDLLAAAPQPEPLPVDPAAAERSRAAFERLASVTVLQAEEELPALVEDSCRDPAALFTALDDERRDVRYAAARVALRMMTRRSEPGGCAFPQRLVEAAARRLRDDAPEVALLHLETIARYGAPWTAPILLKTFGKVDNHRVTVVRIRAAAKLARARCYGGMSLLIKALKEGTSIQDDARRDWEASFQTAWWKDEAIAGVEAAAGTDFGHSPDASDAEQVACVRKIETWWDENRVRLWSESPAIEDPELVRRVKLLILGLGTFQLRNVDNSGFLLEGLGPKVAPWLFEALRGSSFMVREHVLDVLAALIDDVAEPERARWIEAVIPSLSDREALLRVAALRVIGASRIPAALPHLERALAPGDPALTETSLRMLALQPAREARRVLERFASQLPPGDVLTIPLEAARLAAGDLGPLESFLRRLDGERGPDPRARAYLSWIVESDGLADAKTPEERDAALRRIEQSIRDRAGTTRGGAP